MTSSPEFQANLGNLETDAANMLKDLSELTAKLKEVGKQQASQLRDEALAHLSQEFQALQGRLLSLTGDSQKLMTQIDKSVRANPYVYIAGALGLGVLVGKALRS